MVPEQQHEMEEKKKKKRTAQKARRVAAKEKEKKEKEAKAEFKKRHQAFFDEVMQVLQSDNKNEKMLWTVFEKSFDGKSLQEKLELVDLVIEDPHWLNHFPELMQSSKNAFQESLNFLKELGLFQIKKTANNYHIWKETHDEMREWYPRIKDYLDNLPQSPLLKTSQVKMSAEVRARIGDSTEIKQIDLEWLESTLQSIESDDSLPDRNEDPEIRARLNALHALNKEIAMDYVNAANIIKSYFAFHIGILSFPSTIEEAITMTTNGLEALIKKQPQEVIKPLTSCFFQQYGSLDIYHRPQIASKDIAPFPTKTIGGIAFTEKSIQSLQPDNNVNDEVSSFIFDRFNEQYGLDSYFVDPAVSFALANGEATYQQAEGIRLMAANAKLVFSPLIIILNERMLLIGLCWYTTPS
ncbi:MAG: hypothetical protein V4568_14995 [Pseudomonadota bacterium]